MDTFCQRTQVFKIFRWEGHYDETNNCFTIWRPKAKNDSDIDISVPVVMKVKHSRNKYDSDFDPKIHLVIEVPTNQGLDDMYIGDYLLINDNELRIVKPNDFNENYIPVEVIAF